MPQRGVEPPPFQWTPTQPPAYPPSAQQPAPGAFQPDPYGELAAQLTPPTSGRTPRAVNAPPLADLQDRGRGQSYQPQQHPLQSPAPAQNAGYADASGYDLGSYAVPTEQQRYSAPQPSDLAGWSPDATGYPAAPQSRTAAPQYAPRPGQQQPHQQHAQQQPYAPQLAPHSATRSAPHLAADNLAGNHGYADDYGYGQPQAGQQHGGAHPGDHDQEPDDGEYETEPRRSRRWIMVVGLLIGSVSIGGGMAYVYKTMLTGKPGQQTQVVKAGKEPSRTAPDNPGGKRFANTDSKLMNKLDADATGDTDSNGVRRVQTVTVGADRASVGGANQGPRPTGVPGMTIVGADSMPGSGAMPGSVTPSMAGVQGGQRVAGVPAAPAAGGTPRVAAVTPPPQRPAPAKAQAAVAPATSFDDDLAQSAPKKQVQKAAPTVAKAKVGGGYLAVLGYQKNQIDAMKMLADLQQKYDVLRDKKLDVVESDQTVRGLGVIYRVVVGPPGAADNVKSLCTQLVQAGHSSKDCYALAN